jgi:hypothetical protein
MPILYQIPCLATNPARASLHIALCEVKCRHCAHARKFPELSIANGRNQTGEVVYYTPFKRTKVRYKLIGKPPVPKTGVPPESQLAKLEMMNQSSSTSFKSSKWFLRTEMTPSLHSLPISAESALRSTQRKSASACLSKGISNFSELLRIDWPRARGLRRSRRARKAARHG